MSLEPILIGSRKFGIHEDDSDYDYLLIVPDSRISDVLSSLKDADITEYSNRCNKSLFVPFHIGYRIRGISSGDVPFIGNIPKGSTYDIHVIPRPDIVSDSHFILENLNLYRLLRVIELLRASTHNGKNDLISRVKSIRKYAKAKGIYGGAYPDGTCYLIYAINTMRKGYNMDKALKMLHQKCLYYHVEYQYSHIAHVSGKSFKHMEDISTNNHKEGKYQYKIDSHRLDEILGLSCQLLDISPQVMYITNDGIIHASSNVQSHISKWSSWLESNGIKCAIGALEPDA